MCVCDFFFQAEDGIRDLVRSRGLGDVYKRQGWPLCGCAEGGTRTGPLARQRDRCGAGAIAGGDAGEV